jgi:hypothetical protein
MADVQACSRLKIWEGAKVRSSNSLSKGLALVDVLMVACH